jgi:hypothetical protein
MSENEKNNEKDYTYTDYFSNTLGVKVDSVEKLLNEKILNLKERIKKLENNELKREDRKFQWMYYIFGALLGAALTIITQSIIRIIHN